MRQLVLRLILATAAAAVLFTVAAALVLDAVGDAAAARAGAEADIAAVTSVVEVTGDDEALRRGIARTASGRDGRLAVHVGGRTVGTSWSAALPEPVRAAAAPAETAVDGGTVLVRPVGGARPAVVEAFVPSWQPGAGLLGVAALLAGAGAVGAGIGAVVCVRALRPAVADLTDLTATAHAIARGDEDLPGYRPMTTPETAALAEAVDTVARHIDDARTRERRMAADLSHRLRTPLTALALDVGTIGDSPSAQRVRRAVASLDQDVDALIRAAPAEPPTDAVCDVVEVVRRRMDFWSVLGQHGGRSCDVTLTDPPARIALPEDDLAAVVDALMGNIFRHTPAGSAFAVSVVRHAGWISLVVDDAGQGIVNPAAALRRGHSSAGSTGLGLDIARDAVEATGGTIHLERAALGGARIRLRFGETGADHHDPHEPRAWRLWRMLRRESRPTAGAASGPAGGGW
ncbi:HAMP domain-containing sensor histidine kinase [Actinomycetes bacterium KLBMP 9759]